MEVHILNYRIEKACDSFLVYPPGASKRSGGNEVGFFDSLSRAVSWIILNDLNQNEQLHYEQLLLVEEALNPVLELTRSKLEDSPC